LEYETAWCGRLMKYSMICERRKFLSVSSLRCLSPVLRRPDEVLLILFLSSAHSDLTTNPMVCDLWSVVYEDRKVFATGAI